MTDTHLGLAAIEAQTADLRARLDSKDDWRPGTEPYWLAEGSKSGIRLALDMLRPEAMAAEIRRLRAELATARSNALREAAGVAEGAVGLFADSDEGAAAAGAMEGIAIRFRRMADAAQPAAVEVHVVADDSDTLPAWLARRFDPRGPGWEQLSDDDRAYWEHQARAVRRAVARGGFKTDDQPAACRP